jgi:undecaprenol kinase
MRRRSFFAAFIDAGDGIFHAFFEQSNFRIQLGLALIAVLFGVVLHFGLAQWIILILTIGFVLAAELFNTCLEHVVDMVQPDSHPLARSAKHAGAAAVLVASIAAAAIGIALYGPALYEWLRWRGL